MAWPGWENFTGVQPPPKRSKYNAQPTHVDGIRFDSRKEAARYSVLTMLEKAGEIHALTLQPVFPLVVVTEASGTRAQIGTYRGDFQYCEKGGARAVVEDVKGVKTPVYRLKKKMVEAIYGITIREV